MTILRTILLAAAAGLALGAPVLAQEASVSGTFTGASGHETSGGVTVRTDERGTVVVLGDDFSLDGAPDPRLGFGNDGSYDPSTTFAPLDRHEGAQDYEVPATIDPAAYNEFYIWCERFSVPLGVARLQ
ncbi:MAG: DM13 domain-containing protein [Geminicoccaceae bacterium]|nr:DM13 domain-containing protein [Geminicoccaceae bacterium]